MKKIQWQLPMTLLLLTTAITSNAEEHMHDHGDNPILTHVMIDKLEMRDGDNSNPVVLEGQMWVGKDLNKIWLKTDVERRDGKVQDSELQALYSRAISPFWDAQIGVRHDAKPTPTRDWGVIGIQGLSPYWFDVEAALFVGKSGEIAARFSAEYELLFTQKLILSPDIEINLYGQNDAELGAGSGLSDARLGLRLRYEIRREFAPYVGLNWDKTFGNAADFATNKGEKVSDTELVIGLRAWF